jgi:hypothetical protein
MKRVLSIAMLTLLVCACSSPDEPAPPPTVKTEFTWELDTVDYQNTLQLIFNDIHGTASGEVYAVAHCSKAARGILWKYSNGEWIDVEVSTEFGGPLQGIVLALYSLDGIGNEKVWMVGERVRTENFKQVYYGFLASYDGQNFNEVDLYSELRMLTIKVIKDDDIYFGGDAPILYHYNGLRVDQYSLPMDQLVELSEFPFTQTLVTNIVSDGTYIFVQVALDYDQYGMGTALLTFDSKKNWAVRLISVHPDNIPGLTTKLWASSDGTIYTGGYGIYKFAGGSWVQVASTYNKVISGFGTSDRNIWGIGVLNDVIQLVNGNPHSITIRLPDAHKSIDWINGWTNGDEVFLVGRPWDNTSIGVIAHGR